MPSPIRRLAAAAVLSLGFALPASATTASADYTDLWWNSAESGWGVNVIQQGDTLFATFFVYGADSSARWYVASGLTLSDTTGGITTFTGKLYQTTGPWFGASFNPNNVGVTEVGTATFSFSSASTGSLVYTVGSTTVTKQVTRQTWRNSTPAGHYYPGGLTGTASACQNASNNGSVYFSGFLSASLTGSLAAFQIDFASGSSTVTCVFNGTWVQQGRLGAVNAGTWACSTGTTQLNQGTFTLSSVDVQVSGMTAIFSGSDQFCQYSGRLGGLRDVIN